LADNATYYYGTGRRKNAVARVRLYPGEGTIMVNNKPPLQYFGRRMLEMVVVEPLRLTESAKRFNVSAMVDGGGMSGQAGAVQHGIARALIVADLHRAGADRRGSRDAAGAEEARVADPGPAHEGAQEARSQARP